MIVARSRHVILVAQPFTPVEGSHAERVLHLARFIRALGHRLTVITIRVGARYPQRGVEEVVEGAEVFRTYPGVFHSISHGSSHTPLPPLEATARASDAFNAASPSFHKLTTLAAARLKELYRFAAIPDSYADWIPSATTALLGQVSPESVVISTSMPLSTHVATLLARSLRRFHWIADFGDPWLLDTSRPKRSVNRYVHKFLEGRVAQRADALVFTTAKTVQDYREHYGSPIDNKIHLARMGFDATLQPTSESVFTRPTVFYGGSVLPENRSIDAVLKAAKSTQEWDFVFAGQSSQYVSDRLQASQEPAPGNVKLIDWLDRHAYRRYSANATACLVLGNRNPQQVPGKVYQLVGMGARILYVGTQPQADDEAWRICAHFGCWASNDAESIAAALDVLRSSRKPCADISRPDASEYQWSRQLALFAKLIDEPYGPQGIHS